MRLTLVKLLFTRVRRLLILGALRNVLKIAEKILKQMAPMYHVRHTCDAPHNFSVLLVLLLLKKLFALRHSFCENRSWKEAQILVYKNSLRFVWKNRLLEGLKISKKRQKFCVCQMIHKFLKIQQKMRGIADMKNCWKKVKSGIWFYRQKKM